MSRQIGRVAICCDVGPTVGVGHVMRCVALAEGLAARGVEIVFVASLHSVPWVAREVEARGFSHVEAPDGSDSRLSLLAALAVDAVVIDSYVASPDFYRRVVSSWPSLAFVDGHAGGAMADILLDQNLGAEASHYSESNAKVLAGAQYSLVRENIRLHRPHAPPTARQPDRPRVLVVFGGTDPTGGVVVALRSLVRTRAPFSATVVVAQAKHKDGIVRVQLGQDQAVSCIQPTADLAPLIKSSDLVLSAAGSSSWELLCLGACVAVAKVADNQEAGYKAMKALNVVIPLGDFGNLKESSCPSATVTVLREALANPTMRRRFATNAWQCVDGEGVNRVAEAFLSMAAQRLAR